MVAIVETEAAVDMEVDVTSAMLLPIPWPRLDTPTHTCSQKCRNRIYCLHFTTVMRMYDRAWLVVDKIKTEAAVTMEVNVNSSIQLPIPWCQLNKSI